MSSLFWPELGFYFSQKVLNALLQAGLKWKWWSQFQEEMWNWKLGNYEDKHKAIHH